MPDTPPEIVAIYNAADQLKEAGQFEAAIEKLAEALAIDPNYALAHAALSVLHQKLGQHDQAIEHAQKVCELEPSDPFSFTALSVTYQRAFAGTIWSTSGLPRKPWRKAGFSRDSSESVPYIGFAREVPCQAACRCRSVSGSRRFSSDQSSACLRYDW